MMDIALVFQKVENVNDGAFSASQIFKTDDTVQRGVISDNSRSDTKLIIMNPHPGSSLGQELKIKITWYSVSRFMPAVEVITASPTEIHGFGPFQALGSFLARLRTHAILNLSMTSFQCGVYTITNNYRYNIEDFHQP